MIADLKPYAKYRKSGQEWLGSIPEHWDISRAKCLFREVDERSPEGKEELLSVSHLTGVTPRSQKTITMFLAKSNIGHKLCRPGDLVINTLWAWMGALGVAKQRGIVSPAYGVYRPLKDDSILPQYAELLFRTPVYIAEYQRRSTGVNSSRMRLYRAPCRTARPARHELERCDTQCRRGGNGLWFQWRLGTINHSARFSSYLDDCVWNDVWNVELLL